MFGKYVRVQDEHGNRFSVLEQEVAANPEAYEVLEDEKAADRANNPLPAQLVKDAGKHAGEPDGDERDGPGEPGRLGGAPSEFLSSQHTNTDGQPATDTKES